MASKTALSEFIDETLSIVDVLKTASRAMLASTRRKDAEERVELGLHTIKGNAAAFDLDDLSAAAGALLDIVRGDRGEGRLAAVARVVEFAGRAEQYLDRVRDGDTPPAGFFAGVLEGKPPGQRTTVMKRAGAVALPPPADPWEEEVAQILALAPAVKPRIQGLSSIAGREAPEPPPEAAPPAADRVPDGGAAGEDRLRTGAAGYAFEAALAFETVKNLATQYKGDPRLSGLIGGLTEFFRSFGKWGAEARSVPVSTYLEAALESAARHAESLGKKLRSQVYAEGVLVLPGVGDLLREVTREVLHSLIPAPARAGSATLQARASVQPAPGYFTVRLSGLPEIERTSSRLQLYSIQERVEKTGIVIGHDEPGGEVLIDVPDNLGSIEVLVLQARSTRVAVPWHRVIALEEARELETGLRGDGWVEVRGEKVSVVDLTGGAARPARGTEKGPAIVILRMESGKQGVLVDRVLERREMPIQVSAHADWQSDVIGLCISPADFQCMPLLRWSLR